MTSFERSRRADAELLSIYLYGARQFGAPQAVRYIKDLEDVFGDLARHPRMGRLAPDIGRGVRRHEHGAHIILYRELADGRVRILALVHGRSVRKLRL